MTNFTDCRILHGAQVSALLAPIVARYAGEPLNRFDGKRTITLRLETDADTAPVFAAMPAEGDSDYFKVAARVAVAIQQTLRVWLPYLWLHDAARFEQLDEATVLLGYGACKPFTPQNRQSFTFDVLSENTSEGILQSVIRNLPRKLARIEGMLLALDSEHVRTYSPHRIEKVLSRFQKNRRILNGLLVAEREIVETYVSLGLRIQDATEWEKSRQHIRRYLRRLFAGESFHWLEPLLDLEAAQAAAKAMRQDFELRFNIDANSAAEIPLHEHEDTPGSLDVLALLPSCSV